MPQNFEELINIYKKVIEPKLKDWVIFEHGTCVIIYHPPEDLEIEAKEVLKKYGSVTPGTSSGDQPGIINYVSEEKGRDKEDYEIGLIGRNKKEEDSKELKVIYVNNQVP